MLSRGLWFFVSALLASARVSHGAEEWGQLKFGMNTEEATAALGVPLIKTAGGGFELWIFDNQAEALFYGGPLVAWTTPTKGKVAGHPIDIWQRTAGAADGPVFVLPRPVRLPVRRPRPPEADENNIAVVPLYKIRS